MAVSRKCLLDGDVPLARRALPACSALFAIDRLLSIDEARARFLGTEAAQAARPLEARPLMQWRRLARRGAQSHS